MQALRNCSGTGRPARVTLNDKIYERCPRATYLESFDARYFVNVYLSCRKSNTYPAPGGLIDQTQFTVDLFDCLDTMFERHKAKKPSDSE